MVEAQPLSGQPWSKLSRNKQLFSKTGLWTPRPSNVEVPVEQVILLRKMLAFVPLQCWEVDMGAQTKRVTQHLLPNIEGARAASISILGCGSCATVRGPASTIMKHSLEVVFSHNFEPGGSILCTSCFYVSVAQGM